MKRRRPQRRLLTACVAGAAVAAACGTVGSAAEINYSVTTLQPAGGLGPQSWTGVFTVNSLGVPAANSANIVGLTAVSGTSSYATTAPVQTSYSLTAVSWFDTSALPSGLQVESSVLAMFVDTSATWTDLISSASFILDNGPTTKWTQDSSTVFAGTAGFINFSAAVPEPSTWVMAGIGIACVGLGAWRREAA